MQVFCYYVEIHVLYNKRLNSLCPCSLCDHLLIWQQFGVLISEQFVKPQSIINITCVSHHFLPNVIRAYFLIFYLLPPSSVLAGNYSLAASHLGSELRIPPTNHNGSAKYLQKCYHNSLLELVSIRLNVNTISNFKIFTLPSDFPKKLRGTHISSLTLDHLYLRLKITKLDLTVPGLNSDIRGFQKGNWI